MAKKTAKAALKDQEAREFAAHDAIDKQVDKRLGLDSIVIYSAYKTDPDDIPINNLNEIAIAGRVQFKANRDELYGGKSSKEWISPILQDPTWLDLCEQADSMIKTTLDEHHVFLEGVEIVARSKDLIIAELIMGS